MNSDQRGNARICIFLITGPGRISSHLWSFGIGVWSLLKGVVIQVALLTCYLVQLLHGATRTVAGHILVSLTYKVVLLHALCRTVELGPFSLQPHD